TSQGYGANFGGLAPLLTMLNACSAGIGVVNIDNGFGAGCLAHRININGQAEAPPQPS
ncbi:MAG: 1-(5-phosphoribosyl)-5-amino-4-imidazole-carboxylate carboxylase, partial [Nitrospirae bacterium CG_4_9_14_3_um_filter_51_5]